MCVKQIDKTLAKVKTNVTELERNEERNEKRAEKVETLFGRCTINVTSAQEASKRLHGNVANIKEKSEENANCGSCVLDQFSNATIDTWELSDRTFETCVDVLDPTQNLKFTVPKVIQDIIDLLSKLSNAVHNVVEKNRVS